MKLNKIADCIVVIPIYKTQLSSYEKISLKQGLRILKNYCVKFIAPTTLDTSWYEKYDIDIKRFPDHFFAGISGYNKLMLSKLFYESFLQYDYLLVYQLDGFVFEDNLEYFISLNYDYIGAPWLNGLYVFKYNFRGKYKLKKIFPWFNKVDKVFVGNGGVSLRRIDAFLYMLDHCKEIITWNSNEDVFFSLLGIRYPELFRVASLEDALKFSFETTVKDCFKKNDCQIPMFCHAWEKWDIDFWRPYFKQFGYDI